MELSKSIYYLTEEFRESVESELEFVREIPFYKVYQDLETGEYWRVPIPDKYQTEFLVKLPPGVDWVEFDSRESEISLLKEHRGISANQCIWKECRESALNGLRYCAMHAYTELNIRE